MAASDYGTGKWHGISIETNTYEIAKRSNAFGATMKTSEKQIKQIVTTELVLARKIEAAIQKDRRFTENIRWKNCLVDEHGMPKSEYMDYMKQYAQPGVDFSKMKTLSLGQNPSWSVENATPFDYTKGSKLSPLRKWFLGQDVSADKFRRKESLWKVNQEKYGKSSAYFQACYTRNYCPVAFCIGGRNVSLHKLPYNYPAVEKIYRLCQRALTRILEIMGENRTRRLGIVIFGNFATSEIQSAVKSMGRWKEKYIPPCRVLHPAVWGMNLQQWKISLAETLIRRNMGYTLFSKSSLCDLLNSSPYNRFVDEDVVGKALKKRGGISTSFERKALLEALDDMKYPSPPYEIQWMIRTQKRPPTTLDQFGSSVPRYHAVPLCCGLYC